jgi:hypothetical protein
MLKGRDNIGDFSRLNVTCRNSTVGAMTTIVVCERRVSLSGGSAEREELELQAESINSTVA